MRVLFVAAMLVGTLAPFVSGGRAHACLCQPLTAKAQVEMATVILVGTPTGNFDDRANGVAFEIEVDQTIRGSIGDTILVRGMGSCSVDLYPGQRYILLGER